MISGARARRLLVLGLVGAGWLSILGNSPPPTYRRDVVNRTGEVTIVPEAGIHTNVCSLTASVSTPVRRFSLFNGSELIRELTCVEGRNCLTGMPREPYPCDAIAGAPDAGPGGRPFIPVDSGAATGGGDASAAGNPTAVFSCPGPGASSAEIRMTMGPRYYDWQFCSSESATYRFEVETAAGSQSTLEFKVAVDEPGGYFGCD